MEPDSIVGDWSIRVNDSQRITAADFAPTDLHIRGSLAVDITRHLRHGTNMITVDVTTDRHDGGLLNALYLAGGFSVQLDGPTLTRRKPKGQFEAYEANGLPYYAGVVEYEMQAEVIDLVPAGPVLAEFDFGPTFEDTAEVSINGGPWHALPWSPRIVLLDTGELKQGSNAVRVRVYTSLSRVFEGQVFDVQSHAYRDVGQVASK